MTDWRADRIGAALRDENPTVLARLPHSFAVIGDVQWLPGYSVLLADDPAVTRLSDLPRAARLAYLESIDLLASAVEHACAAADDRFLRVNIEILGNSEPFLHTHIWPRFAWEPDERRLHPVWLYPAARWSDPATALSEHHDPLRRAITHHLDANARRS